MMDMTSIIRNYPEKRISVDVAEIRSLIKLIRRENRSDLTGLVYRLDQIIRFSVTDGELTDNDSNRVVIRKRELIILLEEIAEMGDFRLGTIFNRLRKLAINSPSADHLADNFKDVFYRRCYGRAHARHQFGRKIA